MIDHVNNCSCWDRSKAEGILGASLDLADVMATHGRAVLIQPCRTVMMRFQPGENDHRRLFDQLQAQ